MGELRKNLFETLRDRGYVYQSTNEEKIKEMLECNEPTVFYLGIDPTADSLHIGHFFALMMFRHLQDAGHKGILVIGGATALVGDPSGKASMRKMLTKEQVQHNFEEVKALAERFIKTDGDNPAIILNNNEWMHSYSYVDFMRNIGTYFNVNKMLAAETYANRLEEGGLTFLEMGYMLMQAYDFVYLNKKYGCSLQIGGSDQWGNILAGTNLGRRQDFNDNKERSDMQGLTCPLLMTKEGKKMGKTEKGTLWVAREKTTVFDFYQYFYNVLDEDAEMLLRLFTRVPTNEIVSICKEDILKAKRLMAYEITKLVHGEEEANNVLALVKELFDKKGVSEDMPQVELEGIDLEEGIGVIDLIAKTDFVKSKSETRRLILQGGISINDSKVESIDKIVTSKDLNDGFVVVKKGKKKFLKIIFK